MLNSIFDQMEFGPLEEFLQDDDVTDISYSNGGQVWLKTLSSGIKQVIYGKTCIPMFKCNG